MISHFSSLLRDIYRRNLDRIKVGKLNINQKRIRFISSNCGRKYRYSLRGGTHMASTSRGVCVCVCVCVCWGWRSVGGVVRQK